MMFSKKVDVLVTGAKGQLGSYLMNHFNDSIANNESFINEAYGISREDVDLANSSQVIDFFNSINKKHKIGFAIHCAAATDTKAIEEDPFRFFADNVLATKNVAEWCSHNKVKMIFISTDYIFSQHSDIKLYGAVEFPINQYGLQKLIAEKEVIESYKSWPEGFTIARSSWMFGNSIHSFIEKFLSNVAKSIKDEKHEANVVDDCFGRPTHVEFICKALEDVMFDMHFNNKLVLPFDCQPPLNQISRYDWAAMIWKMFVKYLHDKMPIEIDSIVIKACKSSYGHGMMQHPGKVGDGSFYSLRNINANSQSYEYWTSKYIDSNKDRLVKMFMEIVEQKR